MFQKPKSCFMFCWFWQLSSSPRTHQYQVDTKKSDICLIDIFSLSCAWWRYWWNWNEYSWCSHSGRRKKQIPCLKLLFLYIWSLFWWILYLFWCLPGGKYWLHVQRGLWWAFPLGGEGDQGPEGKGSLDKYNPTHILILAILHCVGGRVFPEPWPVYRWGSLSVRGNPQVIFLTKHNIWSILIQSCQHRVPGPCFLTYQPDQTCGCW